MITLDEASAALSSSPLAESFTIVDRAPGAIWSHKTKPAWVVYYPDTGVSREFWQAYKVKDYCLPVPKGRNAWSLDNCRLGAEKDGFRSLNDALTAADSV